MLRGAIAGRWGRPAAVLLTLGSLACAPGDPELEVSVEEPVRVRATVDPERATIGDRITYTLEVAHREGIEVDVPELPEAPAGLRLESGTLQADTSRRGGRVIERRVARLVAERVGAHVIPPVEIAYGGDGEQRERVATPELTVQVESLLAAAEGEATDIRDVKPLRRHGRRWAAVAALIVAALALVALLGWRWWRRRRRRRAGEAPPLPPDEAALQALARLRQTDFGDPEQVRAYYFALSEVVRTYVEGRFGLNATDLTTEEILPRVGSLEGLSSDDADRLRELLAATDRVKFAKLFPSSREIEETFETAVAFVESTRPRDAGKSPGGGAGSAGSPGESPPIAGGSPQPLRAAGRPMT